MSKGERIKAARTEAGLTQEQFAEKIGVVPKIVKDYEGDRRRPKTDRWPLIASVLGQPVGYFFEEEKASLTPQAKSTLTTEERLLSMLERQQGLLSDQLELAERQRQDIASLTEAIKVQQAAFLAERDYFARRATEQLEQVALQVATVRSQLDRLQPVSEDESEIVAAKRRLDEVEAVLAKTRRLPPAKAPAERAS